MKLLIKTWKVQENSGDNHEHNILRLFDTLSIYFFFTTNETKCDY